MVSDAFFTCTALSVNGNQRHSVAYIPQHNVIPEGRIPQSRSYHDYNENGSSRSGSSTPVQGDYETASVSCAHLTYSYTSL